MLLFKTFMKQKTKVLNSEFYNYTIKLLQLLFSGSVMSNSFVTPWSVAHQAPLSMEFSRQEYWSGLPFHSPGELSNPRIEPKSPALQADSLPSEPPGKQDTVP